MFSNRLEWSLEPNELAGLLEHKRREGVALLDLTESNPTKAGFPYPDDLLSGLADTRGLLYEPSPWGLDSARAAVAEEHGVGVDRVMITASTSESYSYLFKLLCSPGDNVLTPKPSYPLFEFLAKLESVSIRQYPLRYDGNWRIDFDALRASIDRRTRSILLVNPNNPTGSYLHADDAPELLRLCARHGLALISDEVFWSYPLEDASPADLAGSDEVLLFRLSGLSKMGGLPQLKAGWMILQGPAELRRQAGELLELIADTFLSVSTPVQHALGSLIRGSRVVREQIHRRVRSNLDYLRRVGSPLRAEGGWYAIQPVAVDEYDLVLGLVEHENVLTQPGFFYDFDEGNQLVLSLLTPGDVFREGLRRVFSRAAPAASTPSSRGLP